MIRREESLSCHHVLITLAKPPSPMSAPVPGSACFARLQKDNHILQSSCTIGTIQDSLDLTGRIAYFSWHSHTSPSSANPRKLWPQFAPSWAHNSSCHQPKSIFSNPPSSSPTKGAHIQSRIGKERVTGYIASKLSARLQDAS